MATPTSKTEEARPERIAYAEEDKLGPLGVRASALHDPIDLRARLLEEFEQAVAAAKAAAATADQGSTSAVHESRKALRRARAVLSMVAGALPKSERRAVRAALQNARRSLSTVRDHAVAPGTLGAQTLDDGDRETAKRVLDNAAEAIPALAEIKQLLGEAAARAAAQAEALAAALPAEVPWAVVAGGIAGVYREARRARRQAKGSRPRFHTWRRRSKELVYQLDFISAHAGARTLAIRADVAAVTDQLGPAVDLVMLHDFVQTYAQGLPGGDVEQLRDELDRQLEARMKDARKGGRDVFRPKPKKFIRRLAKAVKRDLTRADDNGGDNGRDDGRDDGED
jgi:CHAD domain-containing protein